MVFERHDTASCQSYTPTPISLLSLPVPPPTSVAPVAWLAHKHSHVGPRNTPGPLAQPAFALSCISKCLFPTSSLPAAMWLAASLLLAHTSSLTGHSLSKSNRKSQASDMDLGTEGQQGARKARLLCSGYNMDLLVVRRANRGGK